MRWTLGNQTQTQTQTQTDINQMCSSIPPPTWTWTTPTANHSHSHSHFSGLVFLSKSRKHHQFQPPLNLNCVRNEQHHHVADVHLDVDVTVPPPFLLQNEIPMSQSISIPMPRRKVCAFLAPLLSMSIFLHLPPSSSSSIVLARERRSRKTIPIQDYLTTPDGLKYYDVVVGKGPLAVKGSTVQVHFDCLYRGITAVSSRESKLLAGNRTLAQPYTFKVGSVPGRERKREFADNANGLFSAQAAPKPPPVLYSIIEGMRVGGKRTVIVPPEVGYGQRGSNEIPPGATFDLNIELLEVLQSEEKS